VCFLEFDQRFANMETYGKILLIAMPIFPALVLFEKWYGWYRGKDTVRNMDMISFLTSGVTHVTKDVPGLAVTAGVLLKFSPRHQHTNLAAGQSGMN
jgi:hypothetical protein